MSKWGEGMIEWIHLVFFAIKNEVPQGGTLTSFYFDLATGVDNIYTDEYLTKTAWYVRKKQYSSFDQKPWLCGVSLSHALVDRGNILLVFDKSGWACS